MNARTSIRKARRTKRRFDEFVESAAWYLGWFGVALLVACGLLWLIPDDNWNGVVGLRAERLPIYTLVAMLFASLVGWGYVNSGEDRIRRRLGKPIDITLFVVLPLACIAAGLLQGWLSDKTGMTPPSHPFWVFVRWYPPLLVCVSAATFLLWKSRPRKRMYLDRGLGYTLLLGPYALLFAFMEFGLRLDWLSEPMKETFASSGQYAIALQLIVAYFIGGD